MPEPTEAPTLTAHRVHPSPMRLVPATHERRWMSATSDRFAYRCLPLLIANEAGWFVTGAHTVLATWDGGRGPDAIQLEYLSGSEPFPAVSHFGHGILTWRLPFLFRTTPGWDLLMRGPSNWPIDGAHALEGLIETDWAPATATMNWKLTRPGHAVRFAVDEPICMLVPQRRDDLERVRPRLEELASDQELADSHAHWARDRSEFVHDLGAGDPEATARGWQRDYFLGSAPDGTNAPEHRRRLHLAPFEGQPLSAPRREPTVNADTIDATYVPRPRRDVETVELDGETVLYAGSSGEMLRLDALGSAVWACFDGTAAIAELVTDLVEVFETDAAVIEADVIGFVRDLGRAGLLEGIEGDAP